MCVPDSSHFTRIWQCKYLRHCFYDRFRTFLPSSSCVPCARTLSTLDGSEKVMNPNPLQEEKRKKKFSWVSCRPHSLHFIDQYNFFFFHHIMTNFYKTVSEPEGKVIQHLTIWRNWNHMYWNDRLLNGYDLPWSWEKWSWCVIYPHSRWAAKYHNSYRSSNLKWIKSKNLGRKFDVKLIGIDKKILQEDNNKTQVWGGGGSGGLL